MHPVQGCEYCPHCHGGYARSPRVQGWNAFGSASLLFSGYGLQDNILSLRRGGGGRGDCSKVRRENMRHSASLPLQLVAAALSQLRSQP
jgi:hypothetical protein